MVDQKVKAKVRVKILKKRQKQIHKFQITSKHKMKIL